MLREHYSVDKLFEEISQLIPKMDPVLAKVDHYLDDEVLFRLIRDDLSKRRAKTLGTGRNCHGCERGFQV